MNRKGMQQAEELKQRRSDRMALVLYLTDLISIKILMLQCLACILRTRVENSSSRWQAALDQDWINSFIQSTISLQRIRRNPGFFVPAGRYIPPYNNKKPGLYLTEGGDAHVLYMVSVHGFCIIELHNCSLRWYGGNLLDSLMNLVASPSTDVQSRFDVVNYHVSKSIICFSQRGTWMFPNRGGNQKL